MTAAKSVSTVVVVTTWSGASGFDDWRDPPSSAPHAATSEVATSAMTSNLRITFLSVGLILNSSHSGNESQPDLS
ncbi:unannotated protein [freshwater metagenome]|uniref:Unannotated protein n=1 Tax=freshwater metagenome TaxID=449393 RepID=A0A6J6U6R5_9ZZZZ